MIRNKLSLLLYLSCFLMLQAPQALGLEACRFVQLCDTQLGMGGYEADKIRFELAVKAINALAVNWVVICGDLVNDGNADQAVADFKAIAEGFTMPVYLAPGNHDVGNEPTSASLERYRRLQGPDFYAATENGVRLLIVNTQLWKFPVSGESEKQDAWFADQLTASTTSGIPTLIVSHYPPFVETPDEPDGYYNLPTDTRTALLARMKAAGVKGWLAGHVHKNVVRDFQGMPIIASATTSRNFDGAPFGFRVWEVGADGTLSHHYEALEIPPGLIPEEAPEKK